MANDGLNDEIKKLLADAHLWGDSCIIKISLVSNFLFSKLILKFIHLLVCLSI